MQTKNRKIKKEELELWKKVTEHDKILGQYTTSVEENIIQKNSPIISKMNKDNSKVKDIYDDFVVSVDANMNQEEVAQIMQKYDLTVLPVVNKRKKLIGRITIDDVVDVITESAEEERQIMSGITTDVE